MKTSSGVGRVKTEEREIRRVLRDIAVWSGMTAAVFGGIGLIFGPVWAVCGALDTAY